MLECAKLEADNQNQLLISQLARQSLLLKRQATRALATQLASLIREQKSRNFKTIVRHMKRGKAGRKIQETLLKFESKASASRAFLRWGATTFKLRERQERVQVCALTFFQRAYEQRLRKAFAKWAKVSLQMTENQKLQKSMLAKLSNMFSASLEL